MLQPIVTLTRMLAPLPHLSGPVPRCRVLGGGGAGRGRRRGQSCSWISFSAFGITEIVLSPTRGITR